MPKIDEIDLLRELNRGGWVKPEERLTEDQKVQLGSLLGSKLPPDRTSQFTGIVDVLFGDTVRAERAIRGSMPSTGRADAAPRSTGNRFKLTREARDELADVVEAAEALLEKLSNLTPSGRAALDLIFRQEMENAGSLDRALTFRQARERVLDELDRLVLLAGGADIEVRQGGSNPAYRMMVRGLAGLFLGTTGELPTRAHIVPETSKSGEHGEDGLLLDLATLMAGFVNGALPPDLRRSEVPKLTGIVREEIERLRRME